MRKLVLEGETYSIEETLGGVALLHCPGGRVICLNGVDLPPGEEPVEVRQVSQWGQGYTGGHRTAESKGWEVNFVAPTAGAVAWWFESFEGAFTSREVRTISLVPSRKGKEGLGRKKR